MNEDNSQAAEAAEEPEAAEADSKEVVAEASDSADSGAEKESPYAEFLAELKRIDPDINGLEGPASEEAIASAEKELDIKLPPSYLSFLRQFNGGSAYDTTLFSAGADDDFDLARVNLRDREEGLPEHLLAFAVTVSGDVYCFDTSQGDDRGECPVTLLDPEDATLLTVAASFSSWLERLPRLEAELAEMRGPQPMTVKEWEEFLKRERAKLRRLAKTPASELSMPDPEKIRADLGGKIPVDPRHLKPRE